ncbi:hypothetical protein [Zhongshania sp.]|uniref:hypothetical protein n=1 Tax=Zhongshania sp. TaxID=1971902 RepID=UPI00356B3EBA
MRIHRRRRKVCCDLGNDFLGCRRYRDQTGEGDVIVEAWYLYGMAHNYPYGHPEGNYTDPAGPDVTTAGYQFFSDIVARAKQ